MLTREQLTSDAWSAIRNTPHLVMFAVSSAGGSTLDSMLERHAGLKGIVEEMHSTHPLLREIAEATQIMQAQDEIRSWYYKLPDAERTAERVREMALESMRKVVDVLAAQGGPEDLSLYREFVESLAMRVARAAREGDFLGIDGERVSQGERDIIEKLRGISATKAA